MLQHLVRNWFISQKREQARGAMQKRKRRDRREGARFDLSPVLLPPPGRRRRHSMRVFILFLCDAAGAGFGARRKRMRYKFIHFIRYLKL